MLFRRMTGWPTRDWTRPFEELERMRRQMDWLTGGLSRGFLSESTAGVFPLMNVTEGEDKPIKYPDMFHASDLMLLNKVDLLPYLNFNIEQCKEYARRVNPDIKILEVSAETGAGMDAWYQWIRATKQVARVDQATTVAI